MDWKWLIVGILLGWFLLPRVFGIVSGANRKSAPAQ